MFKIEPHAIYFYIEIVSSVFTENVTKLSSYLL